MNTNDLEDIISIIEDRADNGDFDIEVEAVEVISELLNYFGKGVEDQVRRMLN